MWLLPFSLVHDFWQQTTFLQMSTSAAPPSSSLYSLVLMNHTAQWERRVNKHTIRTVLWWTDASVDKDCGLRTQRRIRHPLARNRGGSREKDSRPVVKGTFIRQLFYKFSHGYTETPRIWIRPEFTGTDTKKGLCFLFGWYSVDHVCDEPSY